MMGLNTLRKLIFFIRSTTIFRRKRLETRDLFPKKEINSAVFYLLLSFLVLFFVRASFLFYLEMSKKSEEAKEELFRIKTRIEQNIDLYLTVVVPVWEKIKKASQEGDDIYVQNIFKNIGGIFSSRGAASMIWKNLQRKKTIGAYGKIISFDFINKLERDPEWVEVFKEKIENKSELILKIYLPSLLPNMNFFKKETASFLLKKHKKLNLQSKEKIFLPTLKGFLVLEKKKIDHIGFVFYRILNEAYLFGGALFLMLIGFYIFAKKYKRISENYFKQEVGCISERLKELSIKCKNLSEKNKSAEQILEAEKNYKALISFLGSENDKRRRIFFAQLKDEIETFSLKGISYEKEKFLQLVSELEEKIFLRPIKLESYVAEKLLVESLTFIRSRVIERGLEVKRKCENSFEIVTDKYLFFISVIFLLQGAVERSRKKGKITLKLETDPESDKNFILTLEDDGFSLKGEEITKYYKWKDPASLFQFPLSKKLFLKSLALMRGSLVKSSFLSDRIIHTIKLPISMDESIQENSKIIQFPRNFN